MFKILSPLGNQKGVSLVVVLVATGVLAIGFFAMTNGLYSVLSLKSTLNSNFNISQYRANIISTLSTGNALSRTVAGNSVMSCVTPGAFSDCTAQKSSENPIRVVDANGNILTDPSQANLGFREDGTACNTFNSTTGNDSCPYRFDVSWRPICPGGGLPCVNPQSRFTGTLRYKPANQKSTIVNQTKYNFQIFPAKLDSTLEGSCKAINGTFDGNTGQCVLPMAGLCPPNQVVVSVNTTNNTKNCDYLIKNVCSAGQAIDFVDANGNVVCKTISYCPPSSGPSRTIYPTWDPWQAGSAFGGDGGDGCDGSDGCDGAGGS